MKPRVSAEHPVGPFADRPSREVIRQGIAAASLLVTAACGGAAQPQAGRIAPEYDARTGRLILLKYDANQNGSIDTMGYMDGARVVRIEVDADEDGKVDRWEYYGPDGKIERIALSTKSDGMPARTEWYEAEVAVRAEEDTDGDGRVDKWETYQDGRLVSVAFDAAHRGSPDRRIVYSPDGSAQVETVTTSGAN
jgi:hypothetical protein